MLYGEAGSGKDTPGDKKDDQRSGHHQLWHNHLLWVHWHDDQQKKLCIQNVGSAFAAVSNISSPFHSSDQQEKVISYVINSVLQRVQWKVCSSVGLLFLWGMEIGGGVGGGE